MDPGDLLLLDAILADGGITGAARRLGVPKTTVSRRLRNLESAVGAPLFDRVGRRLRLTPVGQALAEPAHAVRAAMSAAQTVASALRGRAPGTLRIASPYLFARLVLADYTGMFLAQNPDVNLTLRMANNPVDPLREDIDLAISITRPTAPYLILQKLAEARLGLFAPPSLATRVRGAEDLRDLPCIVTSNTEASVQHLQLTRGETTRLIELPVRATTNDPDVAAELVARGGGIGVLPGFLAAALVDAGRLVPVLPDWHAGSVAIHAAVPPKRLSLPVLRSYVDGLKQHLAETRFGRSP